MKIVSNKVEYEYILEAQKMKEMMEALRGHRFIFDFSGSMYDEMEDRRYPALPIRDSYQLAQKVSPILVTDSYRMDHSTIVEGDMHYSNWTPRAEIITPIITIDHLSLLK